MGDISHAVDLARRLIQCPSVTPVEGGALDLLEGELAALGFACTRLPFGDGAARVDNLFARLGTDGPHVAFAGHTDVVPPGDIAAWQHEPFAGTLVDGRLYGRGAADMKGGIAAFVAAVAVKAMSTCPCPNSRIEAYDDKQSTAGVKEPLFCQIR